MTVEDMYIRAAVKESSIPEKQKQRILERYTTKELTFDSQGHHCPRCPRCGMVTPKISKYCCNCGQMVTLEKPVMAILN